MSTGWLALFLLGVLLFSLFGILASTSNDGLYSRSPFLTTRGVRFTFPITNAYVRCYGVGKPVPEVTSGLELLRIFEANEDAECQDGLHRSFNTEEAAQTYYESLHLVTDAAAAGRSMDELRPNQPAFWMTSKSSRVPIYAREFHRAAERFDRRRQLNEQDR